MGCGGNQYRTNRRVSKNAMGGITMTKEFWKAALIRAIRTVAQTAVATIGTSAVLQDVNWVMVGSASILAGILSVLTSIATGLPEV